MVRWGPRTHCWTGQYFVRFELQHLMCFVAPEGGFQCQGWWHQGFERSYSGLDNSAGRCLETNSSMKQQIQAGIQSRADWISTVPYGVRLEGCTVNSFNPKSSSNHDPSIQDEAEIKVLRATCLWWAMAYFHLWRKQLWSWKALEGASLKQPDGHSAVILNFKSSSVNHLQLLGI